MSLDKTILITGGGSGIGLGIAKSFLEKGYKVIILGRTKEKLEEVKKSHYNIDFIVADVSNYNQMISVINSIEKIDILINCAGIVSSVEEPKYLYINVLNDTVDINLKGTIITTSLVIEKMINGNIKGSIINIASIAAHNGSKYFPIYSATKGAIISYTKSIASRYGNNGIRCNIISPGVIKTPMSYIETPDFDDYMEELNDSHPVGRIGNPDDIAKLALFLASDESNFITGEEITIDGGYTLSDE